jgi:predicted MFS family arabinose efflux permease
MSDNQPFWKNPYIVLVLCTVMILISYGTRQSFGLFLIPISESISNGRVEPFSFAVSMQTLIIGLSVPFVSMIADKWLGPIKMLMIGGSLYALGMYLLSMASSELHLTLSVGFLSGLAAAGCGLPMLLSVVGRVAPEKQQLIQNTISGDVRGRVMSLYGMMSRGGTAVGALGMGIIGEALGIQWPVVLGGALMLVLCLWVFSRRIFLADALERDSSDERFSGKPGFQ